MRARASRGATGLIRGTLRDGFGAYYLLCLTSLHTEDKVPNNKFVVRELRQFWEVLQECDSRTVLLGILLLSPRILLFRDRVEVFACLNKRNLLGDVFFEVFEGLNFHPTNFGLVYMH